MVIVEIINTSTDEIKLVRKRSYNDAEKFIESFNKRFTDRFARFEMSANFNKEICKRFTVDLNERLRKVGDKLK